MSISKQYGRAPKRKRIEKGSFLHFLQSSGAIGIALGIALGEAVVKVIESIAEGIIFPILSYIFSFIPDTQLENLTFVLKKDIILSITPTLEAIFNFVVIGFIVYWVLILILGKRNLDQVQAE